MSNGRHLDTLFSVGTSAGLSDLELLRRFLEGREQADRATRAAEAAFEAIVRRHGPMVLGVCRRYLDDPNDADDAFQATFLVLFRRARGLRIGESLGPWLHGVSRRIAARARTDALRRKAREAACGVEPATDPAAEERRRDLREVLDDELDRLPARYRNPIVLCDLEGLTYQEAARQLDCPVGTVGVRLSRGRMLLRNRLTRRGSIPTAGLWAVGPTPTVELAPALPPSLVDATLRTVTRDSPSTALATGSVSASIVSLSEGLLTSMFMSSVRSAALALLFVGLLIATGGLLLRQASARQNAGSAITSKAAPRAPELTNGLPLPRSGDAAQRARELIYFFRTYSVFSRDEEWAQTIRELTAIGKNAVPELVAELDRTDRDATLRSLGFTLRAIGDPRAVPALIRAIPKTLRPPGSDCGIGIADPELRKFMKAHQKDDDQSETVSCGRPVNEILTALERITKHSELSDSAGKDIRLIFLRGPLEQQAQQRASFEQCRARWEAWWSDHRREFATAEELRSVELPKRDQDLVELAGIARYGERFPTGPGVRLGPVRMLRLTESEYANGKSYLDFDTGRVFRQYEGLKPADRGQQPTSNSRFSAWYRQNGIDIAQHGFTQGMDLQLWQIDNQRWKTLESEVQAHRPLQLGPEARQNLAQFGKTPTKPQFLEPATFLFTTREGGRGIVQVFPRDPDADRYRLRYRMWTTEKAGQSAPAVAKADRVSALGTPFGPTVTTVLELPPEGRECLLDLENGRKAVLPDFLHPHEAANPFSLARNERFLQSCRDLGLDLLGGHTGGERELNGAIAGKAKFSAGPKEGPRLQLVGFEMKVARITPVSFNELTVEEVRELLERRPDQKPRIAWMRQVDHLIERPDTFAVRTREGTVGLLQMRSNAEEPGKLTIRYRLQPQEEPKGRR